MTRRINLPIQVTCAGKRPLTFLWQDKTYTITKIIKYWRESGEWWEKAPELEVYHVLTDTQGLYELHHTITGRWLLYRIYD
ncbi:MAG: hypothetical protein GX316_03470 [Firmicutes bacterium]|nr:hypothetical protein [Bacillota bacterium]